MLYDDRANVVAALVVLGLILAGVLRLPAWSHEVTVLGSALTIRITETAMMALLLVGITCTGTDNIVRSHPTFYRAEGRYSFVTWTIPALTTLMATLLMPQAPTLTYRIVGYVLTGLILILIVSSEYVSVDATDPRYPAARLLLNGWAYLLALAIFVVVYSTKARSLISATAVTAVATLLALEFLRGAGQGFGRTVLYALIAG